MATLPFSTQWPARMGGGDTEFVAKIIKGLVDKNIITINDFLSYEADYYNRFGNFDALNYKAENISFLNPKLHTIRHDPYNLWVPGRKVHMVINNRTASRFQFAPVLPVKSVQYIEIIWDKDHVWGTGDVCLYMGERPDYDDCMPWYFEGYGEKEMKQLVLNDGFASVDQFFKWFNTDFTAKLFTGPT